MIRRFRAVLPPRPVLLAYVLLYLLFEATYWLFAWWVGAAIAEQELQGTRNALVGLGCALFGAFRAMAFHQAPVVD